MYDLIIIGAGPGGYVAAERAGAGGLKTLLIEKEQLGGVCLNSGCIPTKTLLNSAKLHRIGSSTDGFGVRASGAVFDFTAAMNWKNEVVSTMRKGIASQMKRFGVETLFEPAELLSRNEVLAGGKKYETESIIIAAGSSAAKPPIPGIDGSNVLTNRELLSLEEKPESLTIIGGGVIGIEFASFFSSIGTHVEVIEMLPEILPALDQEMAVELRKGMKNVKFHLSCRVSKIDEEHVHFTGADGSIGKCSGKTVLCAVGRTPNFESLAPEKAGIDLNRGWIRTDETMRTNVSNIYAVGDITGKSLLAHSASRMAEVAVENILGRKEVMRYTGIPSVVYAHPEIASCGLTEKEAEKSGISIRSAKLPMRINGRFFAENGKEPGFCRVVVNAENNVILGVHLFGAHCSELISSAALMIEAELRVQDVCSTVFPHPTVSEIIRDTLMELNHK